MGVRHATVLVVDDKEASRDLAPYFLVVNARSPKEAHALIGPRMDAIVARAALEGLALLETARKQAPNAVRILICSRIDQSIELAIRSGLVFWLVEYPWREGELSSAVQSALARIVPFALDSCEEARHRKPAV